MNTRDKGSEGERMACAFLELRGFTLLERNFRALRCEIDLIMRDGDTTVFIEVKTRTGSRFGTGREAVTRSKQLNLIRAATVYAAMHGIMEEKLRFDVVEVTMPQGTVAHIKNAFQV